MNNGLGYKLANVPTITGLSTVTADAVVSESVNTETLFLNGVDVSGVITQVPINTANIAILQQLTTGISYSDAGGIDLTTVDNNMTITSGKKLKSSTIPTANDDVVNKLFVDTAILNLIDGAPATLDTLNELAAALADDPNFATTITTLIAGKVSLTATETISGDKTFNGTMIINSGHNWRFYLPSTGITASITLSFPFYQIYPIVVNTPITITLPTPTSAMIGAHLYFKKVLFNSVITFNVVSGTIIPFNGFTGAGSVTMSTTQFQTEFYCNGAIYYQVNTDLPNFVSTDTTQTISGAKTFSAATTFGDVITFNSANENLRQINNSRYNFYDRTAVAGGVYKGTLYSTSTNLIFDLEGATIFSVFHTGAFEALKITKNVFVLKCNNCPTIIGFTDPIASDSTDKIASTRWVQSAIAAGASTTISTTATTTQPYYLVGSISSTTSSDTTLYKNINVYVNPATGGICCNDFNIYNANTEAFNSAFSSLSQFEFRNDATSAPNTTVFYNNNSVGTPTAVLTLNGNSGASTFDGLAAASTTVAVADNNSATTMYPVFTTTGAGQKSLLFDITTSPLSYTPSTGTLRALIYSIPTTIASTIGASSANVLITNNNIGGALQYTVATSGIPITSFSHSETSTTIRSATSIVTGSVGSASSLVVSDAGSPARSFQFVPNASGGALNALTVLNDSLLYGTAGSVGTGALTLSMWSNTTTGVRITPTTALIGAGGAASTPSSYTSYNAGTTTIAGTTINITPNNFRFGTAGTLCNIGYGAGASSNLIITNAALAASVVYTNGQNTFVGMDVGAAVLIAAANNTCVGFGSGNTLTSAVGSSFFGSFAGSGTTTGSNNTFIGIQSGFQPTTAGTGSGNVCIGNSAGIAMTTTSNGNTLVGAGSASGITTGSTNTIIGINAGDNITTGSNNICIGNLSVVPTATNSNQIAIGTSSDTQFIQGQFNWRVGPAITATFTLATPYAQFYTITSLAATTVTLQAPAAAYIGTHIMFKRRANTQVITFTTVGGGLVMMGFGGVALGANVTMTAAQWQCELICDGTSWYQFNMT